MTGMPAEQDLPQQIQQMTRQIMLVERRAGTLAELNRLLTQGRDPLTLAQRAVDLLKRATGASGTFVYLWEPTSERLVLRAGTSGVQSDHIDEIALRLGEGITGWSALMRQPVVIDDQIQADPRFANFPELAEDEFRAMVAVPIVAPGQDALGVFSLWSAEPKAFAPQDVDLATEVGGLLASGLLHAQTVTDLRRQSAAAHFLSTLPSTASTSLQRCTEVLAESICAQLDALLTVVELAEFAGHQDPIRPSVAVAERGETSLTVRAKQVRSRPDVRVLLEQVDPGLDKLTTTFGDLAPVGAITCYRERRFDSPDHDILEALAPQAAALISSLTQAAPTLPLAGRLNGAGSSEGQLALLRDLGASPGPVHPIVGRIRAGKYTSRGDFDRLIDLLRDTTAGVEGVVLSPSAPTVTMLVPHRREEWPRVEQILRTAMRNRRPDAAYAIGIGPLAEGPETVANALGGAETALNWAELVGRAIVVHYDDVSHLRLLPTVALNMRGEARDLLQQFEEIVRHDIRQGTSLMSTLDAYLSNKGSVIDTAGKLFIHRNTLRQRLGRIEELTGLVIDQIEDWTVASLAARLALANETQINLSRARSADS